MQILPIHTPVILAGDDFSSIISQNFAIRDNDILVVSSKVVAIAEGAAIHLPALAISREAMEWSKASGRDPAFCEAVLQETARLHGRVLHAAHGALLTELHPTAADDVILLVPNAGLDQSNIDDGYAIGWPHDPVLSAHTLSISLQCPAIIGDSTVNIRRRGVTAFALATCGIDPFKSAIGKPDLFGHPLKITVEAVADQLAVAANAVMGNAGQSIPAAVIRDHDIAFSDYCGWVQGMKPEDDLFAGLHV